METRGNSNLVLFGSFLVVSLLLLLSGCAARQASFAPPVQSGPAIVLSESPSVAEARTVFKQEVERTPLVRDVVFHTNAGEAPYISYTDPSDNVKKAVQLVTVLPASIVVSFSPGGRFTYPAWKVSYTDYVQMNEYFWLSSSWSQTDAENTARALKVLVLDARRVLDEILAANLERFKQTCRDWRALEEKPPLPEAAMHHKMLAESAYREMDRDKAIDEYLDALKNYSCWPDGQLKLANLLGDTGWYTGAVAHMRYYLELVPDAPDAQSARDKIALWQDKMGH